MLCLRLKTRFSARKTNYSLNTFKQRMMMLSCKKKVIIIITRNNVKKDGGFYYWNYRHSFRTRSKLEWYKKERENRDFADAGIPSEGNILKFAKVSPIVYAGLEFLVKKVYGYKNDPEKLSTTKVAEHSSSGFSISTILSFKTMKNKYNV